MTRRGNASTRGARFPAALVWLFGIVLPASHACFAEPSTHDTPPVAEAGSGGTSGSSHAGSTTSGSGGNPGTNPPPFSDGGEDSGPPGPGAGGEPETIGFSCHKPSGEPLPARKSVTSNDAPATPTDETITVTKASLFAEFQNLTCGTEGCHGGGNDPNAQSPDAFTTTIASFDERPTLGTDALERILSPDLDVVMPPGSEDGSKRGPNDRYRRFGERLLAWQAAGFPDAFEVSATGDPIDTNLPTDPYVLAPRVATALTNIGSCVPSQPTSLTTAGDEMRAKDALFAAARTIDDLPDTIFETDLVSLDSSVLARRGVWSYAPTYPLFSDNAGKMRYVRVPVGESIRYDSDRRDFVIPDNTRFYKTFLKSVTDKAGNVGYRKMETRLIVVRQDEKLADGGYRQHALFASYAWDKDERMARRVTDPLRNGQPFADRLCPYVVDERVTRDPEKNPISPQISETCTYMTQAELADPGSGRIRHYAIPGTDRCQQCHMGSSSHSFILGFNPYQVDRRRDGEGGIYETPHDDELSQLSRLLDYGVVSGIEPGEVKLEESQGSRTPRNDYELKAQGYMMGNCAFCHIPHGYPVVQNPVLKGFELFPNPTTGGIFQFSLERYSPRAKGGAEQLVKIPYVSPAFGDLSFADTTNVSGATEKTFELSVAPVIDADSYPIDWDPVTFQFTLLGPWRSLIWRNTYTPFTYQEDGAIYVHMPRNAPGFDCRVQHIMAEWMLSIPTQPKPLGLLTRDYDQPVVEVTEENADDYNYKAAIYDAARRVKEYNQGVTGNWCPNDDDILDPRVVLTPIDAVTGKPKIVSPPDEGIGGPRIVPDYPDPGRLADNVPDHAHWVVTDITDPADRWTPRLPTWSKLIATREQAPPEALVGVVDELQKVHASDEFRDFAREPLPMGLWHEDCQSQPEVAAFPEVREVSLDEQGGALRRWLNGGVFEEDAGAPGTKKVHFQSRGEAVFRAICQNCHGREADSRSPLASTILEITGGKTRVANFVAGLLGPKSAPGAFAREEFLVDLGATPEDWLTRYVLYMGLGGTTAQIPQVVLNLVATSPFYGNAVIAPGGDNPNMLGSAQKQCAAVLSAPRGLPDRSPPAPWLLQAEFAKGTAHYELWESLCGHDNLPVVHVFEHGTDKFSPWVSGYANIFRAVDDTGGWIYPTDWPVGNQRGSVDTGINANNVLPWCIHPTSDAELDLITAWAADVGLSPSTVPLCPSTLFAQAAGLPVYHLALDYNGPLKDVPFGNQDYSRRFLLAGAMNAGKAALEHLKGLTRGELEPALPYDFCVQ